MPRLSAPLGKGILMWTHVTVSVTNYGFWGAWRATANWHDSADSEPVRVERQGLLPALYDDTPTELLRLAVESLQPAVNPAPPPEVRQEVSLPAAAEEGPVVPRLR